MPPLRLLLSLRSCRPRSTSLQACWFAGAAGNPPQTHRGSLSWLVSNPKHRRTLSISPPKTGVRKKQFPQMSNQNFNRGLRIRKLRPKASAPTPRLEQDSGLGGKVIKGGKGVTTSWRPILHARRRNDTDPASGLAIRQHEAAVQSTGGANGSKESLEAFKRRTDAEIAQLKALVKSSQTKRSRRLKEQENKRRDHRGQQRRLNAQTSKNDETTERLGSQWPRIRTVESRAQTVAASSLVDSQGNLRNASHAKDSEHHNAAEKATKNGHDVTKRLLSAKQQREAAEEGHVTVPPRASLSKSSLPEEVVKTSLTLAQRQRQILLAKGAADAQHASDERDPIEAGSKMIALDETSQKDTARPHSQLPATLATGGPKAARTEAEFNTTIPDRDAALGEKEDSLQRVAGKLENRVRKQGSRPPEATSKSERSKNDPRPLPTRKRRSSNVTNHILGERYGLNLEQVQEWSKPRSETHSHESSRLSKTAHQDDQLSVGVEVQEDSSSDANLLLEDVERSNMIVKEHDPTIPPSSVDLTDEKPSLPKRSSMAELPDGMTDESLLKELFPEVSRSADEVIPDLQRDVPKLSLPNGTPLIRRIDYDTPKTFRERMYESMRNRGDEVAVLHLSNCSTELTEDDFRRLVPKGKHIESWIRDGEFYKVIPGRDPVSLERLPFYYLLFHNHAAALAFQTNAARVHKMIRLHQPKSLFSAVPPPPGFLEDGEDLHATMSTYALAPSNLNLTLNVVMQPYPPNLRALIEIGGYKPVVDDTSVRVGKKSKIHKILIHIEGYEPSQQDLYHVLYRDGYNRGLTWPFPSGISSVQRLRDLVQYKQSFRADAETNATPTPLALNEFERAIETAGLVPSANEDKAASQVFMHRVYNRWIVEMGDEGMARRFVRAYHRRTLPPPREGHWKDEEGRVMNCELLW